jgi:hypothetical protein
VGGLEDHSISTVLSPDEVGLPRYVPLIYHGYRRVARAEADVVAVPLFRVLRHLTRTEYGCRFKSPSEIRRFFRVKETARMILVGVAFDRQLEWFWNKHRTAGVGALLEHLDCACVTAPNFSFFTDVPRYHILYNRKRILLSMERLSSAGVAVVPHLNALTDADWEFWLGFLREHDEISVVAKEFQTGNRRKVTGDSSFEKLVELQQRLGRPLHPLLIGAGRYFNAAARFTSFTIIDSQPFLQSVSRQRLTEVGGRVDFMPHPLAPATPLDNLFDHNVANYERKLRQGPADDSNSVMLKDSGTFLLPFMSSIPNLISHPVA